MDVGRKSAACHVQRHSDRQASEGCRARIGRSELTMRFVPSSVLRSTKQTPRQNGQHLCSASCAVGMHPFRLFSLAGSGSRVSLQDMNRLFVLACFVALTAGAAYGADQRPNVLWIIAEDMSPHLSIYGVPEVRTPNIDALAQRGMRFDRAFVTGAVCSTSRSAFNTGMYQTTLGAHNQRSHRPDEPGYTPHPLPQGVRVLADWMRDQGYLTGDLVHLPAPVGFKASAHTDWNFTYDGKHADT